MTKDDKAILIALAIGDGYIDKNGCIHIEHSQNQEEYVQWKHEFLSRVCKTKRTTKIYKRQRLDKRTNKVYYQVSCHKQHKYFRVVRKWLYKPEKTYSRYILNKLTPAALAVWFMDDGNLRKNISKKTGKISSIQVSLYTHCSKDQAELVRDYFLEVYGIEFKIYLHNKTQYYLCANTENGNKFLSIIRPYVNIPSMRYKVDLNSTSAQPLSQ